ncbi:MAG: hypothetical protein HZC36_11890 [Armatimonadetes bacterium]|nr:hypothetical protein [Armatimonadota bacterium]
MSDEQSKAFLDSATQALHNGEFAKALEFVQQAIAVQPESTDSYVLKGVAHSQLQQADEATEAFRHAIMLSPYNVKAYYNLAVHYNSLGQKVLAAEMAKEAVRIDPKHVGAKDLLGRIENEIKPPETTVPHTGSSEPPAEQPMAPPPGTTGPDPVPAPGPQPFSQQGPAPGPYQQPGQPPQPGQPYYRPGYENRSVHSIGFVENMGGAWTTVGYAIGGIASLFWVIGLGRLATMWSQSGGDFQKLAELNQQQAFATGAPGELLLQLVSLFVLLVSLVWMIMDIADRRGNWLWLLPFVICCCCTGAYGPMLLIYVWKGRD